MPLPLIFCHLLETQEHTKDELPSYIWRPGGVMRSCHRTVTGTLWSPSVAERRSQWVYVLPCHVAVT